MGIDAVRRALERVAVAQRRLDSLRLRLDQRLHQLSVASPAIMPEQVIVAATSVSRPEAKRDMQRVRTLDVFPGLCEAVLTGDVPAQHVDVLTRAVRLLDDPARRAFATNDEWLVNVARRTTPDNFARAVNQAVLRAEQESGIDTTERQRRRAWFRHWVDNDSGMVRLHGELDPESGLKLVGRLEHVVRSHFHEARSDDSPADPTQRPAHLAARALVALVCNDAASNVVPIGASNARAEISVVVDIDTLRHGLHAKSIVSTGTGIDVPVDAVRRMACEARIIPVVMSGDGVVLDMGRSTRLATPHQRRALEAMHQTCAIPRCAVPVSRCEPHHIDYWTNGGDTNLDNLVPLCAEHHRCVHEGGWRLALDPQSRLVTVTTPPGSG